MDDFDELDANPATRPYWAQRHGEAARSIDLQTACSLFRSVVETLLAEDLFQEWAGYTCVDDGYVAGRGGKSPEAFAFRKTRLHGLWPPDQNWDRWTESQLLTAVEFFHDVVANPTAGRRHTYLGCGYHATAFSRAAGQTRYRSEVNEFLADFGDGFEINVSGEVVRNVPTAFEALADDELPSSVGSEHRVTLDHAVAKFRARRSTREDQLDALRHLGAILESLRPRLRAVLTRKDEADMFEVLNRFNIRHADSSQQGDYDPSIFLPWVFYSHLAALHASYCLLEREDG